MSDKKKRPGSSDDVSKRFDEIGERFKQDKAQVRSDIRRGGKPSAHGSDKSEAFSFADLKEDAKIGPGASAKDEKGASDRLSARRSKNGIPTSKKKKIRKRRKYRVARLVITALFALLVICIATAGIYAYVVIKNTPKYDPKDYESRLRVMSTLYDDAGNPMQNIYMEDGQRTLVKYEQLPENLVNSFIAIEDKTFWKHHGFNVIRMVGAVRDSIFKGGGISGTSTITQQLARNLWMSETVRQERTISRKIREAYYARELEKHLTKKEILAAYLNTISLGNHSYGVSAAAQAYFGKNVEDLDLLESAALAAMPASPGEYGMIVTVNAGEVAGDDPRIMLVGSQYVYLYNDTAESRIRLVLAQMLDQGLITQEEYDAALADNIRAHLHPQEIQMDGNSRYFINFAIDQIAGDLLETYPSLKDLDEARQMIYSGGLDIKTTYNARMQDIVSAEFANTANFPDITNIPKDRAGNIITESGQISLFNYNNMIQEDGWFILFGDEIAWNEAGDLVVMNGRRLAFYDTTSSAGEDISVELKDFWINNPDGPYIVRGGNVLIPTEYKSKDENGNLIIKKDLFEGSEAFVLGADGSVRISPTQISLRQAVIQPQGAFVILDNHTGAVKAMQGGRNITGSMGLNRATTPVQVGSSIKPISVYGPAIEMSANKEPVPNTDVKGYGTYWSPTSVIIDEKMSVPGKDDWPKNWYSGYRGAMTMRTALEQSVNTCAVKVQMLDGNAKSVAFMKKLGITTLIEESDTGTTDMAPAPLALGGLTNGISPLAMASAYSSFANGGVHVDYITYTSISDKAGNTVLEGIAEQSQAMDPGTAFIMNDMLTTAVTNGTLTAARISGVPVAGKSGTTEDQSDILFVGNTPKYAAALWIGSDIKLAMTQSSTSAVVLWQKIMSQCVSGEDQGAFPALPENVVKASVSGTTDYFFKDLVPEKLDMPLGDTEVDICLDTGLLATPWCPNHEVRTMPRSEAPEYHCNRHNLDPGAFPVAPGTTVEDYKPPEPDSDGDGYTDAEEVTAGSNPNNPASTPNDFDGDGFSNSAEIAAGSNPRDPTSTPDNVEPPVTPPPTDPETPPAQTTLTTSAAAMMSSLAAIVRTCAGFFLSV
ncbi:MAG: transglycosylase domain-containing protein [Clostridiales Family XIII bacterium]|nr:transglycosylase domain-containing protein [Clostridiales Family XIII bacterium]